MKVKVEALLKVFVAMRNIEKEKASLKWAYGITKNKGKIQGEIDNLAAVEKIMQENEQKRVKYCEDHAEKDKDGAAIIEGNRYKGLDLKDQELVACMEKTILLNKEYREILDKEADVDFFMIDYKDVPEQIAPADYEALSMLIKEKEDK